MKPLDFKETLARGMDLVLVHNTPYLFTNMRIDRSSIPKGFYAYDVRDDDYCSGEFADIREHVLVNYRGTIIGLSQLPLDECGTYWCTDEDGSFIGHSIKSTKEFNERVEKEKRQEVKYGFHSNKTRS